MKYLTGNCCTFLFIILGTVSLSSVAFSQTATLKAYSGVEKNLSQLTTNPIVLMQPGKFIDPLHDSQDLDQQYKSASEFNRMLKPSIIYKDAGKDLAATYIDILKQQEWAVSALLPQQVQDLKGVSSRLYNTDGTPRNGYAAYLSKKAFFETISRIYENTPPDQRSPDLEAQYQTAVDDLSLAGQTIYEPLENRYQQLTEISSLAWRDIDIQNLSLYTSASNTGGEFLVTNTAPKLDDTDAINWFPVSVSALQLRQTTTLPKLIGGVDTTSLHWWHWSDTTDFDPQICPLDIDNADFLLTFQMAILPIKRDWLDQKVFTTQAWRWKSGIAALLSDGKDDDNTGSAPLLAESVILVKEVKISGSTMRACIPFLRKAMLSHHEVGFGPFCIAGAATPSSFYLPPVISKTSIHVMYPQVIGYGVMVLPKSPNSNQLFVWPR